MHASVQPLATGVKKKKKKVPCQATRVQWKSFFLSLVVAVNPCLAYPCTHTHTCFPPLSLKRQKERKKTCRLNEDAWLGGWRYPSNYGLRATKSGLPGFFFLQGGEGGPGLFIIAAPFFLFLSRRVVTLHISTVILLCIPQTPDGCLHVVSRLHSGRMRVTRATRF